MTFPLDFSGSFFHRFMGAIISELRNARNYRFGIKNTKKIVPPLVCLGIKIVIRKVWKISQ
jgi:hypothetical protein